jgi:hypothetical protein
MTYTLENYCSSLHGGPWFGFNNINGNEANKTYANLVVLDDTKSKPSESDCIAGIAALQADWDSKEYARKRKAKYDALNQFELISDDAINGTTTHKDAIVAIKSEFPKP